MGKRLFVAQLPFSIDNQELSDIFSKAGLVVEAKVIINHDTGKSKGFGFVEMSTDEEAQKAIELLNGFDNGGLKLVVTIAKPREARKPRP